MTAQLVTIEIHLKILHDQDTIKKRLLSLLAYQVCNLMPNKGV